MITRKGLADAVAAYADTETVEMFYRSFAQGAISMQAGKTYVLAGVMAHVPSQGPAPHPPQHGVGAARLWAEARRALRLEHGDGIQQMLETCTAELDRSPKDSHADDGPVLWVTAPSYLVAQVVVLEHLAALRVATGCRIGFRGSFRAPPPQWAIDRMGSSRGPP